MFDISHAPATYVLRYVQNNAFVPIFTRPQCCIFCVFVPIFTRPLRDPGTSVARNGPTPGCTVSMAADGIICGAYVPSGGCARALVAKSPSVVHPAVPTPITGKMAPTRIRRSSLGLAASRHGASTFARLYPRLLNYMSISPFCCSRSNMLVLYTLLM
jgi:hypothetical protein